MYEAISSHLTKPEGIFIVAIEQYRSIPHLTTRLQSSFFPYGMFTSKEKRILHVPRLHTKSMQP